MSEVSFRDSGINLEQVLQAIQKHSEIQEQIQILTQQTREENKRRDNEIELLKRKIAELKLAIANQETIKKKDSKFVMNSTKKTAKSKKKYHCVPAASAPKTIFDPKSNNDDKAKDNNEQRQTMLLAKDAIRYIPILNGEDDIGVEDFIKEVHSIQMCCSEKELLLKAIKIDKIVGRAAQSIRNVPIENYINLYDTLRSNIVLEATSDEYEEQLRDLKQGRYESVQNFSIRFRCILNKLIYAITSENPQLITRRIMIEATMRKVSRIYLKGLKNDIGRILSASKLDSLNETEKKAVDIERYLREEEQEWRTGTLPTVTYNQQFSNRLMQTSSRPLATTRNYNPVNKCVSSFSNTERVPFAKRQAKCFKCGELGHVARILCRP